MASSLRLHRNLAFAAAASFLVGASSVQCGGGGSNTTSTFTGSGGSSSAGAAAGGSSSSSHAGPAGSGGDFTIDVQTMDYSAEDFFNNDPPPMSCDGGGMAPVVMGTPECPSDKNLPGCPCPSGGATAACWTGLRKNRDHGDCKDGMTTCVPSGETQLLSWGPCNGEVLPMGDAGKAACECFSGGHWAIDNLEPCFELDENNAVTGALSSYLSGVPAMPTCDASSGPATPWSTDTLTADCTGNFKLCYTLKAGDGNNPQPGDCVVVQVCTSAYYSPANSVVMFPPLPGWASDPASLACVQQFATTGGYGEMSVDGQSDECELVDKVFQHVTYCPLACSEDAGAAGCAGCQAGGGGSF